MSADNYYIIKKHPDGGYAAVMGFASDERAVEVDVERDQSFATLGEAYDWAAQDAIIEYGIHIDPEILTG